MTIATSPATPRELVIEVYKVDPPYNNLMFESSWTSSATQPARPQRMLQGELEQGIFLRLRTSQTAGCRGRPAEKTVRVRPGSKVESERQTDRQTDREHGPAGSCPVEVELGRRCHRLSSPVSTVSGISENISRADDRAWCYNSDRRAVSMGKPWSMPAASPSKRVASFMAGSKHIVPIGRPG